MRPANAFTGTWVRRALLLGCLLILCAMVAGAAQWMTSEAVPPRHQVPMSAAFTPSPNPYTASLAYARCLRQHGVPHPDPDRRGDFKLTPAQERRLRRVGPKKRKAAENACFRHLKGLNLSPLSREALDRANEVLADLAACIRRKGFRVGAPNSQNMSRGRARFGLKGLPEQNRRYWESDRGQKHGRAMLACEKEVDMARRISKIIDEDRRRGDA